MATIQGVYVALFGRPADPIGLSFFSQATNNGANLTAIGDLTTTNEYKLRFEGQSSTQIINSIYRSLFNRDADLAGLTFFANALAAGRLNINNIAIAIFDGAQGSDITIRDLKVNAANAFTAQIDTSAEVLGYTGIAAANSAAAFLATVTTTAPTAAQVTAAVAAATTQPAPTNPLSLTATIGETITGTSGNDVVSGVVDGGVTAGDTGTANVGDTVNGNAGTDTLNLFVTDAVGGGALPAGFTTNGVEIVNLTYADGNNLGALNSSSFAGVQQLWQVDTVVGTNDFQNVTVGTGVTAGFRSNGTVSVGDTVTGAANVAAISVALDNVATGSVLTVTETTAAATKSLTVSGSTAANGTLGIVATGPTALETVNLGLSSATVVTLTATAGVLKTVDMSSSTGAVTANLTGGSFTTLATVNGGSGADVISVSNATATVAATTLNAGAGADTINFVNTASATAGVSTLTGGAGGDSFVFTGGGNLVAVATNADLLASLTIITDFSAGEDVFNIDAVVGARTAQNTVTNAVTAAAATDLRGAVVAAAAVVANGAAGVFEFGGSTYVYGETGGADGLDAGDTLVQLTGVTVAQLSAANFII